MVMDLTSFRGWKDTEDFQCAVVVNSLIPGRRPDYTFPYTVDNYMKNACENQ